ncbi:hypothetical protein [Algirhabdus cladophorae]|uniref:hypothetical protein n=1 Tax=Algirhabdus cladophorae TaxID=3377108 RepID=UPI003B846E95
MHRLDYWSSRRVIGTVFVLNAIMVLLGYLAGHLSKHYSENMAGTYISGILLILLGVISFRIYRNRPGHLIWLIMAAGFMFLAYDDLFKFHEGLDKDIHKFFNITETSLTDRIDDIIIAIYAFLGVATLYFYRAEITRHPVLFAYLGIGFAVVGLSVILDIVTNDAAILQWAGIPDTILPGIKKSLGTLEEVAKLMAEAIFLAGFLEVLRRVKTEAVGLAKASVST